MPILEASNGVLLTEGASSSGLLPPSLFGFVVELHGALGEPSPHKQPLVLSATEASGT